MSAIFQLLSVAVQRIPENPPAGLRNPTGR
jgi:hypothetical protein